jgi:hypothetical protein
MKKMNYDYFVWANDLRINSGEGILGNHFLNKIIKQNKGKVFYVKTPFEEYYIIDNKKKIVLKKKNIQNFTFKYILNIFNIFGIWLNYFNNKKIVFVNFLPLWNIFLFILLPSKTILGPITGSIKNNSKKIFQKSFRNLLFPIFFKISSFIIYHKFKKAIFSTDLLKSIINKKYLNKFVFNFVIDIYQKKLFNKKRTIDLVYYNRDHPNKSDNSQIELIKEFKNKFIIYIVGNRLNINGVKNIGFVKRKKLTTLLSKSKIVLNSSENFYTLFVIDALNHGCNIINNNLVPTNIFDKKKFIILKEDFKKNIFLINQVLIDFKEKKYEKITTKNYSIIKNKISNYMDKII